MSRSLNSSIRFLVAASLLSGCSAQMPTLGPADAAGARVMADAVPPSSIGWQQEARARVAAANMSPLAASRVYAALAVAQYRAVNRIDDADSDGAMPQHGVGAGGRAALEARRGAVAGASAAVLSFLFSTRTTDFEQRVTMEANATPGNVHPQFALGLAIGRAAGAELVERLKTDRFTTPWTGTVPVGPGMWVANGTPAGATFGGVQPYFMTSGDQFRPGAPPAFQSTAFLADLAEVKDFTSNLTDAQRATALYWNLPTGTHTPVGYWNEVAAQYIAELGLNEQAATRVFALTNAAMMDALIGCWEAKYYYWTLRPSQADNQIALAFALPNHPSYPSGHSCVSQSAATVLGQLFPAKAAEVNAWVADAGLSRMYAGIHYRFDITAGQDIGRAAGMLAIAQEATLMQ